MWRTLSTVLGTGLQLAYHARTRICKVGNPEFFTINTVVATKDVVRSGTNTCHIRDTT